MTLLRRSRMRYGCQRHLSEMAEKTWRTSCCDDRMTCRMIATVVCAWLFAAALPAYAQQQPRKATHPPASAAVTLRGCVAESMGHYLLNNATVVDPKATPVPSPA